MLIALLVAAFGWWGSNEVRRAIENGVRDDLQTVLDANVTALEIWMTTQQKLATAMVEDSEIRKLALELLNEAGSGAAVTNLMQPAGITRRLQVRLRTVGYGRADLVTTNLQIIGGAGPRSARFGQPVPEDHVAKFNELFASGEAVIITPFKPRPQFSMRGPRGDRPSMGDRGRPGDGTATRGDRPPMDERGRSGNPPPPGGLPPMGGRGRPAEFTLMQVAAPVRDNDGQIRGALALIINPETEFSRILSVAREGQSGETYAFDQEGLMISRSRFDEQLQKFGLIEDRPGASSALTLELRDPGGDLTKGYQTNSASPSRELIHSVAAAIKGESGATVESFRDYRGVPVVGAWRWLPKQGFGVATQIDTAEAFHPLRILQLVFVILVLLLLLCASGMFVFSYLGFVWLRRGQEAELKARQFGQYTIDEKIGEGGMGVVYKARHALLRRETAIKLLLPDKADAASVERFEREVQLTCRLTHPNTVQVYDYGHTPEGIFYYAMEYLPGPNLHDLVERFGPQPEGRVIHILAQVCESLNEAHQLGLVHRDIKPANVILCNRGGVPGCVKVLDFGLVREYRDADPEHLKITVEPGVIGTPLFMSPEAIKDSRRSDPRSDIYSVGALGYFLLTGEYVFTAESDLALYAKHLTEPPIPPSQRTKNPVSPELEKIILRCLEKNPGLRPQSVGELRALLLTCPHAADWEPAERAAWWEQHLEAATARRAAGTTTSGKPLAHTIKINVAPRA